MIGAIGFDGDDTLWHNESIFSITQGRFRRLLLPYVSEEDVDRRLLAIEGRNLAAFGYGIKGFTLSMIETAIEVTGGRVTADDVAAILGFGREMLEHPVELLDGVRPVLEELAGRHPLVLVTKGDLFDQESKLARSGLVELFARVEIVSEKDEAAYRRILNAMEVDPHGFVMVGNSLRSDVLPVVAIGATAVHVPYHLTWAHERVDPTSMEKERWWELQGLHELPGLLDRLEHRPPEPSPR